MKLLEERIRTHGKIREGGVLKVDSFLNHQMDVKLFQEMGKEFLRLFGDCGVTKILTIEASGIGIACVTAQFFDCPVIFAKKNKTRNIAGDVYKCLKFHIPWYIVPYLSYFFKSKLSCQHQPSDTSIIPEPGRHVIGHVCLSAQMYLRIGDDLMQQFHHAGIGDYECVYIKIFYPFKICAERPYVFVMGIYVQGHMALYASFVGKGYIIVLREQKLKSAAL